MRTGPTFRRWLAARDGSVLPLIAVIATVLLGATALAVDFGALHHEKRRLQGAADLAAIVAAQAPENAERLARLALADNGVASPRTLAVLPGRYAADAALGPSARFASGGSPANAVRLTLTGSAPLVFGRIFTGGQDVVIRASALAAQSRLASLAIGSRLAQVQGGIPGALLGAMLGAQLSLSAMDYEALLSARVDMFGVLDSLATRLNLQAASYSDVLASQASVGDVAGAILAAAAGGGAASAATSALRSVAESLRGSTARIPLASLADLGDLGLGLAASGAAHPALSVGALDLLAATAQIANGTRQVELDITPSVPGTLGTIVRLAIGERPQASVGFGPVGTTVRTAQTRLLIEVRLAAPLGLGQIRLPIYAEIAAAEATLTALTCPWSAGDQLSATVRARPGLLDAAIADVSAAGLAGVRPDLGVKATLIRAPLVSVTGHSRITVQAPASRDLRFTAADIADRRARTVTSTGLVGSLVATLVAGSALEVNVVGLGLGLPSSSLIRSSVASSLTALAPSLDAALDTILRLLGVGVGQADVWVRGVHCGRAVLVQ